MTSTRRMAFVLGALLLVASVVVMAVVGVWAARLPPPDPWMCLDDCTGYAGLEQRAHYYRVTVGALAAVCAAWVIMTLSIPPDSYRGLRVHHLMPALLALGVVMSVGALGALQSVSFPTAAAMWAFGSSSLLLSGWLRVRQRHTSDRAAVVVAAVHLAVGSVICLYPAVWMVAMTSDILTRPGEDTPHPAKILGIPLILSAGCVLYGISILRKADLPRARPQLMTPRGKVVLLTVTGVVMFTAVLAAWPRPEPSHEELAGPTTAPPTLEYELASRPLPEVPTQTTPSTPTAPPGPDARAWRVCTKSDLRVEATGWDGATGKSWGTLRAENVGTTDCALRGSPGLQILQGGETIDLHVEPLTSAPTVPQRPGGVGLEPGDAATTVLFWPGYGTAADYTTPQHVFLLLETERGGSGEAVRVGLLGDSAPFDLKDGVDGGAEIEIGSWAPEVT